MRRIASVVLMVVLLPAAGARGQDSPRPPWKWTDEERIAKRYDPTSMHSRESAYVAETEGVAVAAGREVVQGDKNPELFLPFELYRDLLMRAFSLGEFFRGDDCGHCGPGTGMPCVEDTQKIPE